MKFQSPPSNAVVHVDLDGARHIFSAHGWNYASKEDVLFESGMCRLLEFLQVADLKATLFVIAEDLEDRRKRPLLEEAVRRGHEIGSHTLTHRRLTALAVEERAKEVADSRAILESRLGVRVSGFRAPGLHVDRVTLDLVEQAGYRFDSSLFPGRPLARELGTADAPRPLLGSRLWELPLPRYRPLPCPFHPSYSLAVGTFFFHLGMRLFEPRRVPLVLLMHLTDLAAPLPRNLLPNWQAKLYTLSFISAEAKRARCENMLKRVRRSFDLSETERLLERLQREEPSQAE